jgi:hypothetical protein
MMAAKWVVTWERTALLSTGRRKIPPSRERKTFNSQREAVNFAMSLDEPQRQTVQLPLPGRGVAYLAAIEQMYAEYQEDK